MEDINNIGKKKNQLNNELIQEPIHWEIVYQLCRDILELDKEYYFALLVKCYYVGKVESGEICYTNCIFELSKKSFTKWQLNPIVDFMIKFVDFKNKDAVISFLKTKNLYEANKDQIESNLKKVEEKIDDYSIYNRDIFVCYSSSDRKKVEDIVNALEEEFNTCWVSYRNLNPQAYHYWDEIKKAMEHCKIFLLILSEKSIKSPDVAKEITFAEEFKLEKVEYRIDKTENNRTQLHQFFDGITWIENINDLLSRIYEIKKMNSNVKVDSVDAIDSKVKINNHPELIDTQEQANLSITKEDNPSISLNDFEIDGNTLIKYKGHNAEVVIPKNVKVIGKDAFKECDFIKAIIIPKSVTSIGDYAFDVCDSLVIYCEASSKPTGWDSNWNYSNRPVYWGINGTNFIEQDGIQYVIIDNKAVVTRYVGTSAKVEIPSSIKIKGKTYDVTSMGEMAFCDCYSIASIEIPNSITNITERAFLNCNSLESVELPFSVTSIGDFAFCACDSLTSITIPNSVTSIGSYAFDGCSSLKNITIPSSVTSIGWCAFSKCSSLQSIIIHKSVTTIGRKAFSLCESLIIYCEASCEPNGWDYNWNDLHYHEYWEINETNFIEQDGIQYVIKYGKAVVTRYVGTSINIKIPSSIKIKGKTYDVTSIGYKAFYGCSLLTSIIIPNSVRSIGSYAFDGCSSLTIYCEASRKPFGWNSNWNLTSSSILKKRCPTYWKNKWTYINGVPTPKRKRF